MISLSISAFAEAAKAIRNVPGTAQNIDILDHARLEATKDALTLTMSDLDIEARVTIACKADAPLLAAVPRAVLEFFIARAGQGADEGTIEFDGDMRNVTARHGRARLTLAVLRGEDFFLMRPPQKPAWSIQLRAHELCDVLRRTERALSTAAHHIMLHGPFLHCADGTVKIIGADGSRLHLLELDGIECRGDMPVRSGGTTLSGIILPPKTVKEIQRIFSGDESAVTVCGDDRLVVVEAERIRIVSKLIDATYIDYPRLVSAATGKTALFASDALMRAIDGLLVAPKTDAKGKRETVRTIGLTFGEQEIRLFARGDTGDAEDMIDARIDGIEPGTSISFAAPFLRDVVEAAAAKEIAIHAPADFGLPFHVVGAEGAVFVISQRRF